MVSAIDWISVICAAIGAIVAIITLVTVYVAALQVLSRRHSYRLGISEMSLGPWKSKVVSPSWLKMQTHISVPTITVPNLVAKGWKPSFTLPIGFTSAAANTKGQSHVPVKPSRFTPTSLAAAPWTTNLERPVLAEATWVNFLQGIGIGPENNQFYQMETQAELVNGIVPMRWKGRDLVGICTMLGFSSCEKVDSATKPMPLPTQWTGPLGSLQFRSSADGCIVEYQRAGISTANQVSVKIHSYYHDMPDWSQSEYYPLGRLWYSVGGFYLPNNEVLFLGGELDAASVQDSGMYAGTDKQRTTDEIFSEVMSRNLSDDQMRELLWGKPSQWPDAIRPETVEKGHSQDPLARARADGIGRKWVKGKDDDDSNTLGRRLSVIVPSPGAISGNAVEPDWIESRGIHAGKIHTFRRVQVPPEDLELKRDKHPYQFGQLCMDQAVLEKMKQAFLLLKPDGYYFTPARMRFLHDILAFYMPLYILLQDPQFSQNIFPSTKLENWVKSDQWNADNADSFNKPLSYAMALCNELQRGQRIHGGHFLTIQDIRVISKASVSVRIMAAPDGSTNDDIYWAILTSTDLVRDLLHKFHSLPIQSILDGHLSVQDGLSSCESMKGADLNQQGVEPVLARRYATPLVADGHYSGTRVLAAFTDVILTLHWILQGMHADVAAYAITIPHSVTMC